MAIDVSSAPSYPTGNALHRLAQLGQVIAPPIATGLAYLFAAKAGAWLAFPSAPVSALWAPNAILLAALLLARRERWWIYLLVVLPFHLFAQLPDVPIARVAIQYGANVAEAVLGAWAILRFCPEPRRFNRLRTVVVLILMAGVVAPAVTSLLMVGAFALAGIAADYWLTALVRTITNTFAITALVPLIVHGVDGFRAGRQQVSLWRILEATAAHHPPRVSVHRGFRVPRRWLRAVGGLAVRALAAARLGDHPVPRSRRLQRRSRRRRNLDLGCAEWPWPLRRGKSDRERAVDRLVPRHDLRDLRVFRGIARGMASCQPRASA